MCRKTIYNPDSTESLNDRRIFGGDPDGMINFTRMKYEWALNLWDTIESNSLVSKNVHEKLWQTVWDNLFNPDLFLTKEDRIQIILNRYNYNNLSYWERESLVKELKEIHKDKDTKSIEKFNDIITSLKNITKTLFNNTLIQTTKELRTLIFLKNIFGNNSTEKPNNK